MNNRSQQLPLLRAAPDALREGWHRASEDVCYSHPVEAIELHRMRNDWELKMNTVEHIYGKAAAMRLRTEKAILENYKRLPGLPSSRVGLDTLSGNDGQIDFPDFLNVPSENPEVSFELHHSMEVKLGLF